MDRLCFIATWLDPASGVQWTYQLFYYPASKEVEVCAAESFAFVLKGLRGPLTWDALTLMAADGRH